jgi:hypothetical protein
MYIVKYAGTFGYMKPWSALRDSKTNSNKFLALSNLMGIEQLIFGDVDISNLRIVRHRLDFDGVSFQQETTSSVNYERYKPKGNKSGIYKKTTSIVGRGVLTNPVLYLCFKNESDARKAFGSHILLSRNEDILFPMELSEVTIVEFDNSEEYSGFESFVCDEVDENSICCGKNRYTEEYQYIVVKIFGTPSILKD